MDYVTHVDSNSEPDAVFCWHAEITFVQVLLHRDGAPDRFQRARKFDEERISNRLDLPPVVLWEDRAQKAVVLGEHTHRKRFISLRTRGESHAVCEHDRCESTLKCRPLTLT